MKRIYITTISLFFILILGACSRIENSTEGVQVIDLWSRPALEGNNTAAYFLIMNDQKEDDKLILAKTSIAEFTEIHLSSDMDGVMKMEHQDYVEIKAGDTVEFKPMDYHIMLINLNQDLEVGDTFEIKLTFEKAGTKIFQVEVQEPK